VGVGDDLDAADDACELFCCRCWVNSFLLRSFSFFFVLSLSESQKTNNKRTRCNRNRISTQGIAYDDLLRCFSIRGNDLFCLM